MSKAAKAEGYDSLRDHASRMELVLHDIATGRGPDFDFSHMENDNGEEFVNVNAKLFRVNGGEAGLVLVHTFTSYTDGQPNSTSDVRVVRLDDLPDGGEHYYMSAYGRALRVVHNKLKAVRAELLGLDVTHA